MRISTRMRRQPRAPAMTFLRSVPSDLGYRAFKPLRYGALTVGVQTSTVGPGTVAFMDADGRIPARVTAA
jgi:hypothetical protein